MNASLDSSLYASFRANPNIVKLPPVSFLEMIRLEQQAKLVITDSRVQKETFFFKRPCLILRAETECMEIVNSGAAWLCDTNKQRILDGYIHFD